MAILHRSYSAFSNSGYSTDSDNHHRKTTEKCRKKKDDDNKNNNNDGNNINNSDIADNGNFQVTSGSGNSTKWAAALVYHLSLFWLLTFWSDSLTVQCWPLMISNTWTDYLFLSPGPIDNSNEVVRNSSVVSTPIDSSDSFTKSTSSSPTSNNDHSASAARVLNFLSVPVTEECFASDGRRKGICLNAYECRIQNGESQGHCAHGFGVCCIFTAGCGSEIVNNATYFTNPKFPSLVNDAGECTVVIKKMAPDISQLRLDFLHFNLAQPNRRTGICETDVFLIRGTNYQEIRLCGINHGQHVYYDIENANEPLTISIVMTQPNTPRIWEIKISQIEFRQRAPAGCAQYFQEPSGIIQTMNFAVNGRHLANQDYQICTRQNRGMCSIVYEPCDENSFKIGPPLSENDEGSGDGANDANDSNNNNNTTLIMNMIRECSDKVLMPCDSEEFITPGGGPAVCNLLHCGNSFCSAMEKPCRIESSVTPFNIRVLFGAAVQEESPEDNLGMCLKYEQQPCLS